MLADRTKGFLSIHSFTSWVSFASLLSSAILSGENWSGKFLARKWTWVLSPWVKHTVVYINLITNTINLNLEVDLDQAVWVWALVGDIVSYSWARHFTLTAPLFTQVYIWVPANLMLGVTRWWTSFPSRGGVEIELVAPCYRNRDKLRLDGPLGSYKDFTILPFWQRKGFCQIKQLDYELKISIAW